jgi:hypothetical protein
LEGGRPRPLPNYLSEKTLPPSTPGTPPHNAPHDFGPDPRARQDFALAMSLTVFDDDPGDYEAFRDRVDTCLAEPELAADALEIMFVVMVELARELPPRTPLTEIQLAWTTKRRTPPGTCPTWQPWWVMRCARAAGRRRRRPRPTRSWFGAAAAVLAIWNEISFAGLDARWAAEAHLVDKFDRVVSVATARFPRWWGPADLGRRGEWV